MSEHFAVRATINGVYRLPSGKTANVRLAQSYTDRVTVRQQQDNTRARLHRTMSLSDWLAMGAVKIGPPA